MGRAHSIPIPTATPENRNRNGKPTPTAISNIDEQDKQLPSQNGSRGFLRDACDGWQTQEGSAPAGAADGTSAVPRVPGMGMN
jgi:hypothetical protein